MLITQNLDSEFKKAKSIEISRQSDGIKMGTFDDLPVSIQQKLSRPKNLKATASVNALVEKFYNPFWQRMNWETPSDRKKLNAFYRYFYQSEPYVGSVIDLHTEFPISPFRVVHPDPDIQEYFNEVIDDLHLFKFLLEMVKEFWIIGEVFPCGIFDNNDTPMEWESFFMFNPDFIEVNQLPISRKGITEVIRLEMSDSVKKIVQNGPSHKETGELYKNLTPDMIRCVNTSEKLTLNPLTVSHIKRDGSTFEPHAKSIIYRIIKDIMYRDKLREAQFAVASRHVSPTELYMIGEPGDPADDEEISDFKDILSQTWTDPNRAIVYHHALRAEILGASGQVLNLGAEFERIEGNIFAGLMISRQFLSGEGPTYAGMSVALDVLISRYLTLRNKIVEWLKEKVFAPICEIHELWKPKERNYQRKFKFSDERMAKRKIPWVPDVKWDRANLTDNAAKAQLLMSLKEAFGIVSSKTILSTIDLDPESEASALEEESGTVLDPLTNRQQQDKSSTSEPAQLGGVSEEMGGGGAPEDEGAAPPGEAPPEGENIGEGEGVSGPQETQQAGTEQKPQMNTSMENGYRKSRFDFKEMSRERSPRSDERRVVWNPKKIRPVSLTSSMNSEEDM